jgi:phosphonate transport system substrate-binding protein
MKNIILWTMVLFATAAPRTVSAEPLRIVAVSTLGLRETFEYYSPLRDYVGRKLGTRVDLVLRESIKEVEELLDQERTTLAVVCPGTYVRNSKTSDLEILAAPQIKGQPNYQSYIIVRSDSVFKELADLRGKRFGFTVQNSNAGELAPSYSITRMFHKKPEKFFGSVQYVKSYEVAMFTLARKDVDGVSVDSITYAYSEKRKTADSTDTRIIYTSPRYGSPPFIVKKGMDATLKESIKKVLLAMHNDPEGKAILAEMGFEKLIVPKKSNYNSVRVVEAWASKNRI